MKNFNFRAMRSMVAATALALAAVGGAGVSANAETTALATDATGTLVNTIGSAVAKVVSQNSDLQVRVRAYGGPEIWMPQLNDGRLGFGVHFSATTWLSYNDIDTEVQTKDVRLVRAGAATTPLGFMVRADSDIKSVADLKGRKVAGGYSAHPIMKRLSEGVLKAYGLTPDDVSIVPVPAAGDGANALREGRVDAAWYTVFAPITREIDSAIGLRFLPIEWTPERLKIARESIFPGVVEVDMPVDLNYAPKGTSLLGYEFYILASTHTPDDQVTKLLESLWDHDDELVAIHNNLRGFTNEAAVTTVPAIPYHKAAKAFYESKGAWKPEAELSDE